MKTVIHEKLERLKRIDFWSQVVDTKQIKTIIIGMNQGRLEFSGTDKKGNVIGLYSQTTEILSGGEKKAGTPYTLKDTGEFYRSFEIKVDADSLTIDADGDKGLIDWASESVGALGLTDDQIGLLNKILVKHFIKHFNNEF